MQFEVRRIAKTDTIWLEKSKSDSSGFGFHPNLEGPAQGIAGMFLANNALFVSDDYFGNVKKLDIVARKVVAHSGVLDSKYKDPSGVYFDQRTSRLFCLTSFQDKIYLLSDNLVLTKEIKAFKSRKQFRIAGEKILFMFSIQGNGLFDENLFSVSSQGSIDPNYFGLGNDGETKYLENRFGKFEFPWKVQGCQYLNVGSLTFDADRIVYLDDRNVSRYRVIIISY